MGDRPRARGGLHLAQAPGLLLARGGSKVRAAAEWSALTFDLAIALGSCREISLCVCARACSYSEDDVARPSDTLAVLTKLLTLRLQQQVVHWWPFDRSPRASRCRASLPPCHPKRPLQMRALFERIDVNGDGTLDVDEFLEIYIRSRWENFRARLP